MTVGQEMAKQAEQKALEVLTPDQNYAIAVVGRNIINGAFWGFTSAERLEDHVEDIRNNPNIRARRIGQNNYVIEVKPAYIVDSILTVDPELFTEEDRQRVKESFTDARVRFEKFLVARGIAEENYSGRVAIYCTNKVPSISHQGIFYPAFRLNLEQALKSLAQYAYEIQVGEEYMTAQDAAQHYQDLWKELELTPTRTGVFINIRAMLSSDKYREIRRQLKEKYNS